MKKTLRKKINTLSKEEKKLLKSLTKKIKLSDSELEDLSEEEDDDESEDQTDSEESDNAEETSANKEKPKKNITTEDLQKMIADSVTAALKANEDANKLPSQLPLKKKEPKSTPTDEVGFKMGEFNLTF